MPMAFGLVLGSVLALAKSLLDSPRLAYSAVFGLLLAFALSLTLFHTVASGPSRPPRPSRLSGEAAGLAALFLMGWAPPIMLSGAAALYTTIAGLGPLPHEAVIAAGVF